MRMRVIGIITPSAISMSANPAYSQMVGTWASSAREREWSWPAPIARYTVMLPPVGHADRALAGAEDRVTGAGRGFHGPAGEPEAGPLHLWAPSRRPGW